MWNVGKTRPSSYLEAATIYKLRVQSLNILTGQSFKNRELVHPAGLSSRAVLLIRLADPFILFVLLAQSILHYAYCNIQGAHATKCMCCKVHMLQSAYITNFTCCKVHVLQSAHVAKCTNFKVHMLQSKRATKCKK